MNGDPNSEDQAVIGQIERFSTEVLAPAAAAIDAEGTFATLHRPALAEMGIMYGLCATHSLLPQSKSVSPVRLKRNRTVPARNHIAHQLGGGGGLGQPQVPVTKGIDHVLGPR